MGLSIKNVRALSFDLDDTLYDNEPVIRNAFLALYNYLISHYPDIVTKYDFETFLLAAKTLKKQQPSITDLGKLRRIHIKQVLNDCGYNSDVDEEAFNIFWRARQEVTLYPEVHEILKSLSEKLPMVTISNGNACIKSIGIDQYFQHSINAANTGKAKPDSSMFLLACEKLAIEPGQLIHIGDNIHYDIEGAYNAGCRSIWLNKHSEIAKDHKAEVVIEQLPELLTIDFNSPRQ